MTDAQEYRLEKENELLRVALQKAMAMLDIAELGITTFDRDMRRNLLTMTELPGGAVFRNRYKECGS